jgi:hypothetical protein
MEKAYFFAKRGHVRTGKNLMAKVTFGKEAEKFTANYHLQQRSVHMSRRPSLPRTIRRDALP